MSFDHQDWTPVKIKKNDSKLSQKISNSSTSGSATSSSKIDEDVKPPPMVDRELAQTIQKFRVAKGLTQKQLAQAISLPVQIISDYERGTAVKNGAYVSRIKAFLGITKHNS